MKSQNTSAITLGFSETYKDVIDSFGGVKGMAEKFNWNESTLYKWLSGQVMGLTHAVCIHAKMPLFSLDRLVGYNLDCDPVYIKVIAYFGSQSATAKALGVSQVTVRQWLVAGRVASLECAEKLEVATKGVFHPSDFPHLVEQAKRINRS